ncbi:ABC transporter substrate-binding protein [Paenibacillus albiflavus]|uniref:ABC transporter substrate-binding protein n=1 Tax=Paenibacillus albiflavus TaxID=2545760 RepID=A0A4R4EFQ5_9BACL|nr:ABC transporter substrate-binding protein [Paenibacillus albiflavus]TCZ78894.1 ABC transporter substrate-binding protein [Paenibacillus albiflavus]
MKKLISVLAIAMVLLTSACSGSNNTASSGNGSDATPAPAATTPPEDTTPVKIQYWHAHAENQMGGVNYMIEEFQKKYPYITVEPVFQGGYSDLQQKLQAAIAAKEVPAVTNIEVSAIPGFSDSGALQDLNPYIERDKVDTADFSQGMLNAYAFGGKQVGLPLIVSTSVMVYNKTLFDKLGVTPPQTWDEIEAFNQKVTLKEGDKTTRYAFAVPGWDIWYHDPWLLNGGGTILNADQTKATVDSPESLRYFQNFKKWFDEGSLQIGVGKGASDTMRQMFLDEKIGMVQHSSAIIKTYVENAKFEVGVSFVPGDKTRISNIGGAGIVMMAGAKDNQKEAAWKFINFMTSAEHNIKWAESVGYLPTHKSSVQTEDGKKYQEKWPQYKAVLDNFDNVTPRYQHVAYTEFSDFYKEAINKMVLEKGDPAKLMQEAAVKMNKVLEDQ